MEKVGTAAVIVAAGMSSRMGAFKPLLPLGGSTVIRTLVGTCRAAGAGRVVMVTGHRGEELSAHVADLGVECLFNPDYETTKMARSVRIALEAVAGSCDRVLFCPVDMPLWLPSTARALEACGSLLAKPTYEGQNGHPLLIDASLIAPILGQLDAAGLSAAVKATGEPMAFIPVDDPGCVLDADTPEQYEQLCALAAQRAAGLCGRDVADTT